MSRSSARFRCGRQAASTAVSSGSAAAARSTPATSRRPPITPTTSARLAVRPGGLAPAAVWLAAAALGSFEGLRERAARSHARIRTHAYQCEPSGVPAEHQAEAGAGQRAHADDDGRVGGGRPGRPQLRVGRPGESGRGEPADAGQQDRRDRLGRERHRPRRPPRRRSAPRSRTGGRAGRLPPCPRPGTWRSPPAARRAPVSRAEAEPFLISLVYSSPATRQYHRSIRNLNAALAKLDGSHTAARWRGE